MLSSLHPTDTSRHRAGVEVLIEVVPKLLTASEGLSAFVLALSLGPLATASSFNVTLGEHSTVTAAADSSRQAMLKVVDVLMHIAGFPNYSRDEFMVPSKEIPLCSYEPALLGAMMALSMSFDALFRVRELKKLESLQHVLHRFVFGSKPENKVPAGTLLRQRCIASIALANCTLTTGLAAMISPEEQHSLMRLLCQQSLDVLNGQSGNKEHDCMLYAGLAVSCMLRHREFLQSQAALDFFERVLSDSSDWATLSLGVFLGAPFGIPSSHSCGEEDGSGVILSSFIERSSSAESRLTERLRRIGELLMDSSEILTHHSAALESWFILIGWKYYVHSKNNNSLLFLQCRHKLDMVNQHALKDCFEVHFDFVVEMLMMEIWPWHHLRPIPS